MREGAVFWHWMGLRDSGPIGWDEVMAYATIAEMEVCLADCVRYCEQNPGSAQCVRFGARLKQVLAEFHATETIADRQFSSWRREEGLDKASWKRVATLLRDVQRELREVDAIGYPDQRVMYWDEELLEAAARQMMDYLRARSADFGFATEYLTRFEQAISAAHGEGQQSGEALRTFHNHVGARREALTNATQLISEVRSFMRKKLGADHPDYRSIRWVWALSPDEPVL